MGRLRDREMEFARGARKGADVVDAALGISDELPQPNVIVSGGIHRGELRGETFDGALRVHDLSGRDAGKVELHGQGLGEQPGIATCDARAAAGADLDLDHALSFQRSQRIARDDAADRKPLGQILFRAEEIARTKLLGEQRLAYLRDDLRRHGGGSEGNDLPLAVLDRRMKPHANARLLGKASNDHKDNIFVPAWSTPSSPSRAGGEWVSPRLRRAVLEIGALL